MASDDETHEVLTTLETFAPVREALEAKFGQPVEAEMQWRPANTIVPPDDSVAGLLKLIDALEDNDDVQHVFTNMELTEAQAETAAA